MDALMAALVAALLVLPTERSPWLAAILADRYRKPGVVIAAAMLALGFGYAIAACAGALIGPRLTPEAQQLFVALALVSAGGSAFLPIKPPKRFEGWRTGAFATAFAGIATVALGDRLQFIVLALAARSPVPALAAIGAVIGALAIIVPASIAGEKARRRVPFLAVRIVSGLLLLIVGLIAGLGAVGLI